MKKEKAKIIRLARGAALVEGMQGFRVGRIVRFGEDGTVSVDFPGNNFGPMGARTTTSSYAKLLSNRHATGLEVLLAFIENEPSRPIIVDTMSPQAGEITQVEAPLLETEEPREVTINGKRMEFDMQDEIVLKCGKASITLTRAGKVLIKGEYILSRSSGENSIKGGSVTIN